MPAGGPLGMKRSLQKSEPVWHGLVRIAQAELTYVTELTQQSEASTEQVIHGLRLSIKRVRAMWRLLRPHLDRPRVSLENARLREAAHALGVQRDRSIAGNTLRSLMDDAEPMQRRVLARCLRSMNRSAIDHPAKPSNSGSLIPPAGSADISTAPASPETPMTQAIKPTDPVALALGVLRESVTALSRMNMPPACGWELIQPGLEQAYTRARKGWRRVRCAREVHATDDELLFHDWRRDVKRLLYQLEPLREIRPDAIKALQRRLTRLGEQLGDYHDLCVLETCSTMTLF
ncbi:MAG: CHAD domain-containing protein [Phycisphaerales bacterium]|nr:CHAD domain-containing protein [Phycisphaerales bacterium]